MNHESFKSTVLPLKEKLFFLARGMLANDSDAADAVQETFLKLWNARQKLAEHPNVGGYATQTLKNICVDKLRATKYNIALDGLQFDVEYTTPQKCVEAADGINLIKTIIQRLPPLQQEIIRMRDIEEYELSEIADITGSNISAVKVNLSRARKKVREIYMGIHVAKEN